MPSGTISTFHLFSSHIQLHPSSMVPKNNKSMTARSKATNAEPVQEAAHVITSTRAIGPVTRSMIRTSTQISMEVLSVSTPVFGSTSSMRSSPTTGIKDVPASIEKTFVMLELGSGSKFSKYDDDSSSTGLAFSHKILQSKFSIEDYTASFAAKPAMMTNTLNLEEQVSNISKMMKTMMKHIKD